MRNPKPRAIAKPPWKSLLCLHSAIESNLSVQDAEDAVALFIVGIEYLIAPYRKAM
jgi:hypothetical protein